jgi:hypothetical protein
MVFFGVLFSGMAGRSSAGRHASVHEQSHAFKESFEFN